LTGALKRPLRYSWPIVVLTPLLPAACFAAAGGEPTPELVRQDYEELETGRSVIKTPLVIALAATSPPPKLAVCRWHEVVAVDETGRRM